MSTIKNIRNNFENWMLAKKGQIFFYDSAVASAKTEKLKAHFDRKMHLV